MCPLIPWTCLVEPSAATVDHSLMIVDRRRKKSIIFHAGNSENRTVLTLYLQYPSLTNHAATRAQRSVDNLLRVQESHGLSCVESERKSEHPVKVDVRAKKDALQTSPSAVLVEQSRVGFTQKTSVKKAEVFMP